MNVRVWLNGGVATSILAAGIFFPAASQAQSYDLFNDFGSQVFAYGSGTNGSSFSAFTNSTSNCFGSAGVTCYNNSDNGYPFVAKNGSGVPTTFFPTNALSFQAATGGSGSDALIQFTAPTAGIYTISGFFAPEDPSRGGSGQLVTIYDTSGGISSNLYSAGLFGSYQQQNPFGDLTTNLNAGDTITFGVANLDGDNRFLTSGIEARIQYSPSVAAAVPEPVSWAMMIAGFGMVGGTARYRRRRSSVNFA